MPPTCVPSSRRQPTLPHAASLYCLTRKSTLSHAAHLCCLPPSIRFVSFRQPAVNLRCLTPPTCAAKAASRRQSALLHAVAANRQCLTPLMTRPAERGTALGLDPRHPEPNTIARFLSTVRWGGGGVRGGDGFCEEVRSGRRQLMPP